MKTVKLAFLLTIIFGNSFRIFSQTPLGDEFLIYTDSFICLPILQLEVNKR